MEQQQLFYEDRFLESWAGSIVTKPSTAIIELIANCWDAYSTEVNISWPDTNGNMEFSISDNGVGMTISEFEYIWRAMSYNRITRHGKSVEAPSGIDGPPRYVFGRNGKGRFASFFFSDEYLITSKKDGQKFTYRVCTKHNTPLVLEKIEECQCDINDHGTEIKTICKNRLLTFNEAQAREFIGSRFLVNPSFKVFVNGRIITFNDISDSCLAEYVITVKNCGKVKILHIDTRKADKTSKQHGIAWWVNNRAVGECKWTGTDYQRILDGRTSEAKRYTFIVQANFLSEHDAIKEDWSWFKEENATWKLVQTKVQKKIKEIIHENDKSEREYKRKSVIEKVGNSVNSLPLMSKDRVETFINEVIDNCPNFGELEIVQLSSILTKLEKTKSRYGILEILHNQDPKDIDALHNVLTEWTINMAKIVLDEIQNRLKLINEIEAKVKIKGIDEVHELQPLFEKGLWMFGPQFESIEFTSNKGMTTVIREIFKDKKGKGSRNRPDYVVLPDCSVGFYDRSSYDEDYNEFGSEHLVIVDLKTVGLPIGSDQIEQVWKYIKELKLKGYITSSTRVDGFILGSEIESGEEALRGYGSLVKVTPVLYSTIIKRAEKRMLNLNEKVKTAPFIIEQQEQLENFIKPIKVKQQEMFV